MALEQSPQHVNRANLKNDVASTSRFPSTDTTQAKLIKPNKAGRLLILQAKAWKETQQNDNNRRRPLTVDGSILRFLTPAEILHRAPVIRAVITLMTLQVTTAFAAQTYLITDLGTLPNASTASAAAINDSNQVVGTSGLDAFLLSNGKMQDLGNLGSTSSAASLNSLGDVVGSASTSSGTHLFLFHNGVLSDLGIPSGLNGGAATGVNNGDQVVGQFNGGSRRLAFSRAFLWQNGGFTDLGTLGGQSAAANGVNNSSQIVGWSLTASGQNHAFIWQNGTMQDLGTLPGGAFSSAAAINDTGAIVGSSDNSNFVSHAVLFQNGAVIDLGVPSNFTSSAANALNANGVVVGVASAGSYRGISHAFVAQNGSITDLNRLIPGNSGPWVLLTATGVNDAGEIVGTGTYNGTERAFLLTPTNQPTVPAVPIDLSTSSGDSVVVLSWEGSIGATSYNVKRSLSSSGPFTTIANVDTTTYTDKTVTNCSLYYYVVSALNSAGESPNSASVTGAPQSVPAAPSHMTAKPDHNRNLELGSAVDLAWQNNAGSCFEGNLIERSTDGVNFQALATYPPNQNTGTDGFLNPGTRYYYRVRAQSNGGQSGPSNVASVIAPPAP